jgi:hypothetical protein
MAVPLSSFLKGFRDLFLSPPILPCTADEHDQLYKNSMKKLQNGSESIYILNEWHKTLYVNANIYLSSIAVLLSSFFKGFGESFLSTPILLTLVQKVWKSYLYLKNRTARTGQAEQEYPDRTARTEQPGYDSQDMTARTGQEGTRQAEQDRQNRIGRTGQAE